MNALELADNIMQDNCVLMDSDKEVIATMLRQQQAEIEALKMQIVTKLANQNNEAVALMTSFGIHPLFKGALQEGQFLYTHPVKEHDEPNWKEMYWHMHELNQKHCFELLKLKAHPVKELADEEIAQAWAETKGDILYRLMPFARAILRKAQE